MLLLYPMVFSSELYLFSIYIPLCFYFIKIRKFRNITQLIIYIPLCFYFIASNVHIPFGWSKFTFHYASTLSDVIALIMSVASLFTFHYASTLSHRVIYAPCFFCVFTFHYASTLSSFSRSAL